MEINSFKNEFVKNFWLNNTNDIPKVFMNIT